MKNTQIEKMYRCARIMSAALVACLPLCAVAQSAERSLVIPNAGFENGLRDWRQPAADGGMSRVLPEAAHRGKAGLRIVDESDTGGSELLSALLPAKAGQTYRLNFYGRVLKGDGMGVFLVFYDQSNAPLTAHKYGNEIVRLLDRRFPDWMPYELTGTAPTGSAFVGVRLHSINNKIVTAELDDFTLELVDTEAEAQALAVIAQEQLEPFAADVVEQWNASHPGMELSVEDIAPVCSDFRVNFTLLTEGDWQYVAFYDPERSMTIGRRKSGGGAWEFQTLPSKVGHDNHNFIALGLDGEPQVLNGMYGAFVRHVKYGNGFHRIDPATKQLGARVPGSEMPWDYQPLPARMSQAQSRFPEMQVNWSQDKGVAEPGHKHQLRWETLPTNRDKPPTQSARRLPCCALSL